MMKQKSILTLLALLGLGMASVASAATWYNGDVNSTTLGTSGDVNIFNSGYAGSLDVRIGDDGSTGASNVSFSMTGGSTNTGNNLYVGYGADADNCSAVIDGSSMTANYWISVGANSADGGGQGGDNCSLTIRNGGSATSGTETSYRYHYIGAGSAANAALTVTGPGSRYVVKRIVNVYGTGSTITVENGGMAASSGRNDGGFRMNSSAELRLNGGFLVCGKFGGYDGLISDSQISLFNGSDWVGLETLDAAQRTALGYNVATYSDATTFESATGLDSTGLDFGSTETPYTLTVYTSNYSPIPEPATMAIVGVGLLGMLRRRRR